MLEGKDSPKAPPMKGGALLFSGAVAREPQRSKKARGRRVAPAAVAPAVAADDETAVEAQYPMFLLPVAGLLGLAKLESHQALLRRGELVRYDPGRHAGRIIFVSHTWAGYAHPDPENEQLHCLKRVLQRMMRGEISRVDSNLMQSMVDADPFHVTADEMKAAVPDMFLWLDFVRGRGGCWRSVEECGGVWRGVEGVLWLDFVPGREGVCCALRVVRRSAVCRSWLCGQWQWRWQWRGRGRETHI